MKLPSRSYCRWLFGVFAIMIFLAVSPSAKAWNISSDIVAAPQLSADGSLSVFLVNNKKRNQEVIMKNNTGQTIWSFTDKDKKNLGGLALSADGRYLTVIGNGVRLFSVKDKKNLWSWPADGRDQVAISADGQWIVAGGYGAKVYFFKNTAGKVLQTWDLGKKEDSPWAVAVSDDGAKAAAATNKTIFFFKTKTPGISWQAKAPSGEAPQFLKFSHDGTYLFGRGAHTAYLWKTNSNQPIWQKTWKGSLIGAAMTDKGDKIVVSSQTGVTVFNNQGTALRSFENSFGNSDVVMANNGRYFYVNSGSRRIYAFDDSYADNELRPFRIFKEANAGGQGRRLATTALGNMIIYPQGNNLQVDEVKPSILALSPSIPVLLKGQILDLDMFVTYPKVTAGTMSTRVALALPNSVEWWESMTGKVSDKESTGIKAKLLEYASEQLPGHAAICDSTLVFTPGSSQKPHCSGEVPDIGEESSDSFNNSLAEALKYTSPAAFISELLSKIRGPLGKLIGSEAANIAIEVTNRAISGAGGNNYPELGMGTVTLYDAEGKFMDQDSFYFMYLR